MHSCIIPVYLNTACTTRTLCNSVRKSDFKMRNDTRYSHTTLRRSDSLLCETRAEICWSTAFGCSHTRFMLNNEYRCFAFKALPWLPPHLRSLQFAHVSSRWCQVSKTLGSLAMTILLFVCGATHLVRSPHGRFASSTFSPIKLCRFRLSPPLAPRECDPVSQATRISPPSRCPAATQIRRQS